MDGITKTIIQSGKEITLRSLNGGVTWHYLSAKPIVTDVPMPEPTGLQAASRPKPNVGRQKIVCRAKGGGFVTIRRKLGPPKSTKKHYQQLDKAAAMRELYRNEVPRQLDGEHEWLPHEIAYAALRELRDTTDLVTGKKAIKETSTEEWFAKKRKEWRLI